MTILRFPQPPSVPDVILPPPDHPEGCLCEWCLAVKRSSKARHPSVYAPPDPNVVDYPGGRKWSRKTTRMMEDNILITRKRAEPRIMPMAKLKREEERAAARRLKTQQRATDRAQRKAAARNQALKAAEEALAALPEPTPLQQMYRGWLAKEQVPDEQEQM